MAAVPIALLYLYIRSIHTAQHSSSSAVQVSSSLIATNSLFELFAGRSVRARDHNDMAPTAARRIMPVSLSLSILHIYIHAHIERRARARLSVHVPRWSVALANETTEHHSRPAGCGSGTGLGRVLSLSCPPPTPRSLIMGKWRNRRTSRRGNSARVRSSIKLISTPRARTSMYVFLYVCVYTYIYICACTYASARAPAIEHALHARELTSDFNSFVRRTSARSQWRRRARVWEREKSGLERERERDREKEIHKSELRALNFSGFFKHSEWRASRKFSTLDGARTCLYAHSYVLRASGNLKVLYT